MKKFVMAVLSVVLLASTSKAAQIFTTPDGTFTAKLIQGIAISTDSTHENIRIWHTDNVKTGEVVEMIEVTGNKPTENTKAELEAVKVGFLMAGGELLSDKNGIFDGYHGKQFIIRNVINPTLTVTAFVRTWANNTGKIVYVYIVGESSTQPENPKVFKNKVNPYLESVKLVK